MPSLGRNMNGCTSHEVQEILNTSKSCCTFEKKRTLSNNSIKSSNVIPWNCLIKCHPLHYNPYYISGGDQDHRQDEAGRGEPGEGAARGGGDEAAGPPLHHPALPGDPFH